MPDRSGQDPTYPIGAPPAARLHADECTPDLTQIAADLATIAPSLAHFPLTPWPSAGTDTLLFRLGPAHLLRLPRHPRAVAPLRREAQWLPRLAPHLPLPVPRIVAQAPAAAAPENAWFVTEWIAGQDATQSRLAAAAPDSLAAFVAALHTAPGAADFPRDSGQRGGPLTSREAAFASALPKAAALVDLPPRDLLCIWEAALAAAPWAGQPVWLHADLIPGNILVQNGKISAVIDFGALTTGDPAYDLIPAWFVFDGRARDRFLDRLAPDPDSIARARGIALSQAIIALPYYAQTNPVLVRSCASALARLLA